MHYTLDWMAYLSVRCGNLLLYLHSVTIALLILHSSLKWQFLQSCSICLSLSVKEEKKTLIFFHLKGLLHCPFKSTGSMHIAASLLYIYMLHHDFRTQSWLNTSKVRQDLPRAKELECVLKATLAITPWVLPPRSLSVCFPLYCRPLCCLLTISGFFLLPTAKHDGSSSPYTSYPWRRAWRGDGERIGREWERGTVVCGWWKPW